MKISFTILYVTGVLLVKNSVSGKSSIFNKYSNGAHFDSQKQDDAAFEDAKNFLEKGNPESLINSLKRSADDVSSRWNNIRKRSPYGLVYNQGKPIGILEPIPQSFEYSSYPKDSSYRNSLYKSQWFPVKRESDLDLDELEQEQLESQSAPLHSNNYANVLAKFKVNNKVKHRPYQDYLNSQAKRAVSTETMSRRKEMEELKKRGALDMGDLKANLKTKLKANLAEDSSNKESSNKVDEIEENLKDVMDDMGLVEKDKDAQVAHESQPNMQKREIYFEDEDLENGLNKIGFTKESHGDRNKKEDCPGKTKVAKSKGSKKFSLDKSLHKKGKKKVRKDEDAAKRSVRMSRKRITEKKDMGASVEPKMKVANYQYEGEEFIRKKRQEKEAEKDDSEIMKGLETSGELTVSGNKSPLVAVSNNDDSELKKSQEKRDKEELEYEKRLERNIQAKINSIKDEVKREISKLKLDEAKKDQQRKKRDITNTLLDEETSILDPDLNIDHKLEPHIRKRRDAHHQTQTKPVQSHIPEEKREIKKNSKEEISINKMVREATKPKNIAKDQSAKKISQKVKRSDPNVTKIEKNAIVAPLVDAASTNEAAISKRENKVNIDELLSDNLQGNAENKLIEKRHRQNDSHIIDLSELKIDLAKNVEKRENAFVATDKVETDNKAEVGTDAPGSIVKRSDLEVLAEDAKLEDAAISETAADVAKRNEKDIDATTEHKCLDATIDIRASPTKIADDSREDRSIGGGISDLETGQTILKDIDADAEREERQLANSIDFNNNNNKEHSKINDVISNSNEEGREERSVIFEAKQPSNNSHQILRRNDEREKMEGDLIKSNVAEAETNQDFNAEKSSELLDAAHADTALEEENNNEETLKKSDIQADVSELTDDSSPSIEERSVDNQKAEIEESEDAKNGNSFERSARKTFTKPLTVANRQDMENEEDSLNDEINDEIAPIGLRRKRRANNMMRRHRRKRDENSYSENRNELMRYRGDDGEIDDEDDEMQDDGFDDQTSNFLSKRQADYDEGFEANEDLDNNEDYPIYMERNKRNALRMYDDENDAEESHDNFLFYPNRYSRTKRHNYDDLVAVHGGGTTRRAAAIRERSMQPYEQNLRRKRLEKMNRVRDQNSNVADLSDSDIFGGFPQSYEGELSRFKRVKRSYIK